MANCYKTAVLYLIFLITIVNGNPRDGEDIADEEFYDPEADVDSLKNAIDHNDTRQIIDVVTKRTSQERQEIFDLYKIAHGDDLIEMLNSTLTGNLKNLIVALMTPLYDYYARELKDAASSGVLDEGTIIEILSTIDLWEVDRIKNCYEKLWGNSLELDLKANSSDHFRSFIDVMINPDYDYKSDFRYFIGRRTGDNLLDVFNMYMEIWNENLDNKYPDIIRNDLSEREKYFAAKLRRSLNRNHELDQRTLIRIIVTRSEFDLYDIIKNFGKFPHRSFRSRIEQKTNGDYQIALVSIITQVIARHVTTSSSEESGVGSSESLRR